MGIISLDHARLQCRVDGAYDDLFLTDLVDSAQEHVQDILNRKIYATQADLDAAVLAGTSTLNPIYPTPPIVITPTIRRAMLMLVAHWYDVREAVAPGTSSEVPYSVSNLLWSKRIGVGV